MRTTTLLIATLLLIACGPAPVPQDSGPVADLVLQNGNVVTVDDKLPRAQAIAIIGDRIAAVGSNEEIAAFVGDRTELIDLAGQTAIPGFIEGHPLGDGAWLPAQRARDRGSGEP